MEGDWLENDNRTVRVHNGALSSGKKTIGCSTEIVDKSRTNFSVLENQILGAILFVILQSFGLHSFCLTLNASLYGYLAM